MNIADMGIVAVPVITVIVFLVAELVKAIGLDNRWIPVICGFCGGILGMVAMFLMPEYPAKDYLTACAVGIVSGLAATGAHQVYVQLVRKGDDNTTTSAEPAEPEKTEIAEPAMTNPETDEYQGKH